MTAQIGDLDLARMILSSDDFLEGHKGLDADEYFGDAKPSEPGIVSLHMNGEVARSLLIARGWKFEARYPQTARAWYAPDGDSTYWGTDEALMVALVAECI